MLLEAQGIHPFRKADKIGGGVKQRNVEAHTILYATQEPPMDKRIYFHQGSVK